MSNFNNRSKNIGSFIPEKDDNILICRCEEITKGEIRKAVYDGIYTLTEMRRYLRSGMGLCQGQTCGNLVKRLVSKELGIHPLDLTPPVSRPPVRPVVMEVLANEIIKEVE